MDADKADEHIEDLKESERYVLEVYVRGVGGGDVADDRSDRGCLSSACCDSWLSLFAASPVLV